MAEWAIFNKGPWVSLQEKMSGWEIFCFTCNRGTQRAVLRSKHLGHDVDWAKNGKRLGV